jgi:hypothetical protein
MKCRYIRIIRYLKIVAILLSIVASIVRLFF